MRRSACLLATLFASCRDQDLVPPDPGDHAAAIVLSFNAQGTAIDASATNLNEPGGVTLERSEEGEVFVHFFRETLEALSLDAAIAFA